MVDLELATFDQIVCELQARSMDFVLIRKGDQGQVVIETTHGKTPTDVMRDLLVVHWSFMEWLDFREDR